MLTLLFTPKHWGESLFLGLGLGLGDLLLISGALVFTSGDSVFVVATQGLPLDHLALSPGVSVFLVHGTVTIRQTATPRALHRKMETHPPGHSEKDTCLPVPELWPEGLSLLWHTYGALWSCSQGTEAGGCNLCTLSLPPPAHWILQKGV